MQHATGISMCLQVGGESVGSRGCQRPLTVVRISKYTVADQGNCIMGEMRGTGLDNSSTDSAVWKDNVMNTGKLHFQSCHVHTS